MRNIMYRSSYAQSLKEYIGYMAGRIELDTWVETAIENVAAIRRIKPMSEIYQLLQAHVYIIGKKFEEAKWILENYNYNRFAIGKDPITNCYYLFLTALIRENDSHMERVLNIGTTYMRHQDSWLLLYMILHLDKRYRNPYKKLEVLEQQFEFEVHVSALFYLEAYLCYQAKPTLLEEAWQSLRSQVLEFCVQISADDEGTGALCGEFCQSAESRTVIRCSAFWSGSTRLMMSR